MVARVITSPFANPSTNSLLGFMIALTLGVGACDSLSPAPKDDSKAAGAPTEGKATEDPNAAEQAKLSAAIECLNRHSGRVFEARDSYLGDVDPKTGVSTTTRAPVLIGLYGHDSCSSDVKKANALTPAVPELDRTSLAYVEALEGLVTVYETLSGYYQKGEHLDDKGKQIETLHPKVMAAFETFGKAHEALSTQVSTLNRARRVADLAAREKAEGRNLEVLIDSMMLDAETLVELASSDSPDATALDAQVTSYGKLVDEVATYANGHPDEAKHRGSMGNLKNYGNTFLAASKVISRKVKDKAEVTDDERSKMVDQYNSLVENYNHH